MAESMYDNDYFLNIKRDPESASASVPIPLKRPGEIADLRDFSSELDLCMQQEKSFDIDPSVKMEDDDIFQVDKADLIQGPTLAELNADPESLFDDINFDDLFLPTENDYRLHIGDAMSRPIVQIECSQPFSPAWSTQSPYSPGSWDKTPPLGASAPPTAAWECIQNTAQMQPTKRGFELLSSSAPTKLSIEQIWQRREPRKHLLSTSSLAEAGSASSISTAGLLSPELDASQDDDETDEDSDKYEDFSSDDSDAEGGREHRTKHSPNKKEKFFWQYNVQSKGPKGQRLVLKTKLEDPHVLNSVTDPVFSPSCSVRGIKHSGKARKGDGNDLTPNPRKLFAIGKELDKLSNIINDMIPVSELPFNVRPKTRKEKNKLASRACRLKKKAQHEANKLKLHGLEQEHRRLINGISQMKQVINSKITENQPLDWDTTLGDVVAKATAVEIAGRTSQFVNEILGNVKSGKPDGGLAELF